MARVMLAWELGGGLGHVRPLARLAAVLLRRGHGVDLVWKDLSTAEAVLGDLARHARLRCWQAPIWLPRREGRPEPSTHAEVLLTAGYDDPAGLTGLLRAWRHLIDLLGTDLVVADHAPTALLSSRGRPVRRAVYGNGFTVPPALSPLPSYREWEATSADRVAAADERLLLVCNAALTALDGADTVPLTTTSQLYRSDETFLLGWPELDHLHASRGPAPSWGWPASPPGGAVPAWPPGDGPRVFGYLHAQHPAVRAAVAALQPGPWRSLLFLAGLSAEEAAGLCTPWLRVTCEPVDTARALADAALLVGSGSSGTLYAALAAGVPSVMLPMQAEQMLLARRVSALGAGVSLWPQEVESQFARSVAAVLGSPGFARAARAVAARGEAAAATARARWVGPGGAHDAGPDLAGDEPLDDDPVTAAIAARCERLIAGR